jgi:hypothetical protein
VDALATARRLAAARPQAMLPCPVCAASVRGENLARHVDGKHAGVPVASSWVGRDRRVRRTLTGLLVVALAAVGVVAVLDRDARPVVGHAPAAVVAAFCVVAAALAMAAVVATGVFRARLTLSDDALSLRYALGTRRRRVRLPARVEVGRLERVRGSGASPGDAPAPGTVEPAGTYLAVVAGRRRLAVGCAVGTGLRGHWSGWRQGRKRRAWDVTLRQGDFVALQYGLYEHGLLRPRD